MGKIALFEIKNEQAVKVSEPLSGEAATGVVFTADSQYVLFQMNVEKASAFTEWITERLLIPVNGFS